MQDAIAKLNTCVHCGHEYTQAADVCPSCGAATGAAGRAQDDRSAWARRRDALKLQWVAAVIAFWVSGSVLAVIFVIDGKLNLVVTSITLGMLVLGVWLKTRYQLHMREDPGKG